MVSPKFTAVIRTYSVHVWNKNHISAYSWTLQFRVVARINLRMRIKPSMNLSTGKYLQVADSSGRDFVLTPAAERRTDPTVFFRVLQKQFVYCLVTCLNSQATYVLRNIVGFSRNVYNTLAILTQTDTIVTRRERFYGDLLSGQQ